MALACRDRPVTIFTVDPFTGNPKEQRFFPTEFKADFERNLAAFIARGTVQPLVMSSGGASILDLRPNLVFVDGSHIYEDALFDITTWYRKLKIDSRFAVHDTTGTHPSVREALNHFLRNNNLTVYAVTGTISWLMKVKDLE